MRRRLVIQARAEADSTEAALWYDNQAHGLGGAFLAEVRSAIERVVRNPLAHRRLRRRPEVRRVLMARFPYRVFYILRPDAIIVFRVLHAARHDREWRRRV
jgi:plasmid stabilization system protein ParE